MTFPHILGGDGAGVVEEVSADVRRVGPGDAVMFNPGISCYRCAYCESGEHGLCVEYRLLGEHLPGTLAEYIVVPEHNVVPIPTPPAPHAPLAWSEAAAFSLVTLTAWHMLMRRARLRPGELVLIWGVGGGVASTALKIAKLSGAFVVVTSSDDAKLDAARALGADGAIHHEREDVVKRLRALSGRRGADVVVDSVGEATWDRSLRALGRGGRLVTCGATTGNRVSIDLRRLFWHQWDLLGSTMGSAGDYADVVRLLGQGHLRPTVDSTYPIERAADAFQRMARGDQMGKLVMLIDGEDGTP